MEHYAPNSFLESFDLEHSNDVLLYGTPIKIQLQIK